jgi:hypothetical protein
MSASTAADSSFRRPSMRARTIAFAVMANFPVPAKECSSFAPQAPRGNFLLFRHVDRLPGKSRLDVAEKEDLSQFRHRTMVPNPSPMRWACEAMCCRKGGGGFRVGGGNGKRLALRALFRCAKASPTIPITESVAGARAAG